VPSQSAQVQRFRDARRDRTLVVLEGFHALKHALRFGAEVVEAIAGDVDALRALAAALAPDVLDRMLALVEPVAPDVLAATAAVAPPTGVMAIARRPAFSLSDLLGDPRPAPVVLLEDPRNLGNLGACVRVAAAADAAGVLTVAGPDPWHPDAVRGAAGLHFALPVARVDAPLLDSDRPLVAVDPDGDALLPADLPPRAILAFGSERQGLSDALLASADAHVRIPMREGVSSLNLATSAAAVLFAWRLAV
jgi:TrmH family RNA methyltransferase